MASGTLIQKIIDSHFAGGSRRSGETVEIVIDQALTQDATGTLAALEFEAMKSPRINAPLAVFYVDHNLAQFGPENRNDHLYLASVAAKFGAVFSAPGNGVCHQLHLERFGAPGKTLLGADSHTPTGGGVGMLAIGAGGLDVARAMAGRPFAFAYPKIIGIRLSGSLAPWVSAKDVILTVLMKLGVHGNAGWAIEYFGPGVASLSVTQRATISNMGAELGVTAGVFPSDDRTLDFLRRQGREKDFVPLAADPGAEYDRVIELDLSQVVPLAACPSSPGNVKPLSELAGKPVDQVLIGSCTNGSYRDLAWCAMALAGKRAKNGVGFSVAPGSRQTLAMLARTGLLNNFIAAGARILEPGCGACIGQGVSPADDTVSVRTFNRNFAGRSGTKGDQVYLVGCESAVAAALTGCLTDPRTLGFEPPVFEEPERYDLDAVRFDPQCFDGEIIRKRTIGPPPSGDALPESLDGTVLIKAPDQTTTDHIMPAGAFLKYRSNIPIYSRYVFNCFNQAGKESFAERAERVRDAGGAGVILGGLGYGQGSSREHAAVCPRYLGVRVVAALGLERIHRSNLINFGIVPLIFADPADYAALGEGDVLSFPALREELSRGTEVTAVVKAAAGGAERRIRFRHDLAPSELATVLAGGRLNQ